MDGNSFREQEQIIYKTFQDTGMVDRLTSAQLLKEKVQNSDDTLLWQVQLLEAVYIYTDEHNCLRCLKLMQKLVKIM
jgi:hypothetical protein